MRRAAIIAAVLVALCIPFGVAWWKEADREANAAIVPLDQVPAGMLDKAKAKLPEVKFDNARRLQNGNYEIRGKAKNGKVREVELNANGDIVEVE